MLQKFDVCEPNDDRVKSSNALLQVVKKEPVENAPPVVVGSENEGSVGVVGGEVSVVAKRQKPNHPSRHQVCPTLSFTWVTEIVW